MSHPQRPDAAVEAIVVHRNALLRAGIAAALSSVFRVRDAGNAALSAMADTDRPRLVVADHDGALQALGASTRRVSPGLPGAHAPQWLVVSPAMNGGRVRLAMSAGVLGYVHASCSLEELCDAARAVAAGRRYLCRTAATSVAEGWLGDALTPRERDVLRMLCLGLDNKSIGLRLGVAAGTVKTHVKTLLQKLDARSRTQAATEALRRGLLDEPTSDFGELAGDLLPRHAVELPVFSRPVAKSATALLGLAGA